MPQAVQQVLVGTNLCYKGAYIAHIDIVGSAHLPYTVHIC